MQQKGLSVSLHKLFSSFNYTENDISKNTSNTAFEAFSLTSA